jgi:hypothetical protein
MAGLTVDPRAALCAAWMHGKSASSLEETKNESPPIKKPAHNPDSCQLIRPPAGNCKDRLRND